MLTYYPVEKTLIPKDNTLADVQRFVPSVKFTVDKSAGLLFTDPDPANGCTYTWFGEVTVDKA